MALKGFPSKKKRVEEETLVQFGCFQRLPLLDERCEGAVDMHWIQIMSNPVFY